MFQKVEMQKFQSICKWTINIYILFFSWSEIKCETFIFSGRYLGTIQHEQTWPVLFERTRFHRPD